MRFSTCPYCNETGVFVTEGAFVSCMACGFTINDDKKPNCQEIYQANRLAANWFYESLLKDKEALSYFTDRGLSMDTIKRFGLGFAKTDGLYEFLKKNGVTDELMIRSGLFKKSEEGEIYPRFRGRVMFPIMDEKCNVCGFGGRLTFDGKPKYLNTPETDAFHKGSLLYGMHVDGTGPVILCEGYMDVIALHQAGFTNARASLGTAFTREQCRILRGMTDTVFLMYDMDDAGRQAIMKCAPILKGAGLKVMVTDLFPTKDPDEFLKNGGMLMDRINQSSTAEEFFKKNSKQQEGAQKQKYFKQCADYLM